MKYILSTVFGFVLLSSTNAQNNEFSVTVGGGTMQEVIREAVYRADIFSEQVLNTGLDYIGLGGDVPVQNFQSKGFVSLGYKRYLKGKSDIGVSLLYQPYENTTTYQGRPSHITRGRMGFLQFRWNITYVNRPYFQTYFGLSGGVGYETNSNNGKYIWPGFHIHALGLRIGKRVGVFGEVGLGTNGILNGGIFAKF